MFYDFLSVPSTNNRSTVTSVTCDHLYATMASTRKLKHKLNDSTVQLESCKKKLKLEQQFKSKCLKQKISTLSSIAGRLEELNLVSSSNVLKC